MTHPSSKSPALEFEVVAICGKSRTARMTLPHMVAETPMFMPVGTYGSVKGLTTKQMLDAKCQVILGNTYHLENAPGSALVDELGGLHEFIGYPNGMLTDSGGFQMVSLLHCANITEKGVKFISPKENTEMMLTPEESIKIQNQLGADIIMQLDDVVPSTQLSQERFEEATYRTTRWLDRCIKAHSRPNEQSLFPIVQGGLDLKLRDISIEELSARNMPGYAIGGLVGGESKTTFVEIVNHCTQRLPAGKPRYVMGVGYPIDIVLCCALGADMFDSVYPTRTARMGVALVDGAEALGGTMRLKNKKFAEDFRPVQADCPCPMCTKYTRSYMHYVVGRDLVYAHTLITLHNVTYMQRLTQRIRDAIKTNTMPDFVKQYATELYGSKEEIPDWVKHGMSLAGVELG